MRPFSVHLYRTGPLRLALFDHPPPPSTGTFHTSQPFTESVIREMTREALKHGAVNLSQGFPDFAAPSDIKQVAMQAIADDINQYAITWGARDFREAIAKKTKWYLGLDVDPETELTVTCGSTEGMIAAMMATVDPGDEVVIFEPSTKIMRPMPFFPMRAHATCRCARQSGHSIQMSCAQLLTLKPKQSLSAIQTIRPEKFLRIQKWSLSRVSVRSLMRSALRMRFTSTSPTRARTLDSQSYGAALRQARPHRDRIHAKTILCLAGASVLHRVAGDHERHPQGARLLNCRRRRPVTGAGA